MSLPSAQEKQAQAEESFVSKINTMIQKAEPEIGCVCKEIPAVFPFNKHPIGKQETRLNRGII